MRKLAILAALVSWAVSVTGCGTVLNTCSVALGEPEQMRIYGGVQIDLETIAQRDGSQAPWPDDLTAEDHRGFAQLAALDLPFSLLGDTVALPVMVPVALVMMFTHGKVDHDSDFRAAQDTKSASGPG
jgi:uncharacterized protein YceK